MALLPRPPPGQNTGCRLPVAPARETPTSTAREATAGRVKTRPSSGASVTGATVKGSLGTSSFMSRTRSTPRSSSARLLSLLAAQEDSPEPLPPPPHRAAQAGGKDVRRLPFLLLTRREGHICRPLPSPTAPSLEQPGVGSGWGKCQTPEPSSCGQAHIGLRLFSGLHHCHGAGGAEPHPPGSSTAAPLGGKLTFQASVLLPPAGRQAAASAPHRGCVCSLAIFSASLGSCAGEDVMQTPGKRGGGAREGQGVAQGGGVQIRHLCWILTPAWPALPGPLRFLPVTSLAQIRKALLALPLR